MNCSNLGAIGTDGPSTIKFQIPWWDNKKVFRERFQSPPTNIYTLKVTDIFRDITMLNLVSYNKNFVLCSLGHRNPV